MIKAVFPGSFDPPTFGHLDIIERASGIFDELFVIAADNHKKQNMLPVDERIDLLNILLSEKKNIHVMRCNTLVVDFMHEHGITVLIRGIRGVNDFLYEAELSRWNQILQPNIETILMMPRSEYAIFSSSAVRELMAFGKDLSMIVPEPVRKAIEKKADNPADHKGIV
ncbi:MAG: pantetheine-phosphate adenylyltransferase [Spirochaetaceae bacterium]|nr:pantetheine-phosphate adenylyltransferase [Spirochaetaceae bacterium]